MDETQPMGISISLEGDYIFNPDASHEQEERINRRKTLVSPAVMQTFPERDFVGEVAAQMSRSRTELDDEDKGYAEYLAQRYHHDKEKVVAALAGTQIEDSDLVEYANTVFALQKELSVDGALRPDDAPRLIDTSESLDKAKLFHLLARNWRKSHDLPLDKTLAGRKLSKLTTKIMDISGANTSPRPENRGTVETTELFNLFTELEDYEETLEGRVEQRTKGTFVAMAKRVALETHSTEQSRLLVQVVDEVADFPDEKAKNSYIQAVSTYTRNHALTEGSRIGLREKLLPAIQANEPQVAIIVKGGNIWGMRRGDFGAGDYICHAYASEVTPANINKLLMALREVPSTDLARLEQNRLDALTLMAPFGALRDFIHDQRPLVHETIEAMVHNEQEFNDFIQQVQRLKTGDAAYNMISGRTIKRVHQLAQHYKQQGDGDLTGALWSGNTDHELIGLIDMRAPSTAYGTKHREEKMRPAHERLKGD